MKTPDKTGVIICAGCYTLNLPQDGKTYNFDADTGNAALNEAFSLDNCVFENNTCSTIGVVYYAGGSAANINGNKFLNNKVNTSNGATLYMGFKTNCTITNNIFDSNAVTATSKRSSGGLMIGNAAVITGNNSFPYSLMSCTV